MNSFRFWPGIHIRMDEVNAGAVKLAAAIKRIFKEVGV